VCPETEPRKPTRNTPEKSPRDGNTGKHLQKKKARPPRPSDRGTNYVREGAGGEKIKLPGIKRFSLRDTKAVY